MHSWIFSPRDGYKDSNQHLQTSMENPFIRGWVGIIHEIIFLLILLSKVLPLCPVSSILLGGEAFEQCVMVVVQTHYRLDGHLQCNGIFQFLNQVVSKFVFNAGQTKYKWEQIMDRNTPGITKGYLHFNANLRRGPQLFSKPQAPLSITWPRST